MSSSRNSVETVVITGGKGFVGQWLEQELTTQWPNTTVVLWDLPEIDITNPDTYRASLQQLTPDWMVHLAALASVPEAEKNPDLVQRVNVDGTRVLLETLSAVSPRTKVLFASTADIYSGIELRGNGNIPELPLSDLHPNNVYSQSKKAAEEVIETSYPHMVIRVRPFPHIGPGQRTGFVTADFASQVAAIEKGTQAPTMMVGNLEAQRDFTDVRDVVRAYRLLMERGTLGEIYNVASGTAVSIQYILDSLLALSKETITITQDLERMRPSNTQAVVGNAEKLRAATDWQPAISLSQSLSDILDWWRVQ